MEKVKFTISPTTQLKPPGGSRFSTKTSGRESFLVKEVSLDPPRLVDITSF